VLASCAAGDEIEQTVGSVTQQVDDGLTAVPAANGLACDTDRRTFELALEAFTAMTGAAPVAEADLVTQGFLRSEIVGYDLDPTGSIVPAPGSNCG
jgi:hypothetical protein